MFGNYLLDKHLAHSPFTSLLKNLGKGADLSEKDALGKNFLFPWGLDILPTGSSLKSGISPGLLWIRATGSHLHWTGTWDTSFPLRTTHSSLSGSDCEDRHSISEGLHWALAGVAAEEEALQAALVGHCKQGSQWDEACPSLWLVPSPGTDIWWGKSSLVFPAVFSPHGSPLKLHSTHPQSRKGRTAHYLFKICS